MKKVIPCCEEMNNMIGNKGSSYQIAHKKIGEFKSESGVYIENIHDEDSGLIMKMKFCPFCSKEIQVM